MGSCSSKTNHASVVILNEKETSKKCDDQCNIPDSKYQQENLQSVDAFLKHIYAVKSKSAQDILLLKDNLSSNGWLHLSSKEMIASLKFFGATTVDLCRVADPTSSPHSQLWFNEPLLPWKRTQASRFILRKMENVSSDPESSEDRDNNDDVFKFEGYDSNSVVRYEVDKKQVDFGEYWKDATSNVRSWEPLHEWYASEKNSVYMAYQKLSHFLIDPNMAPAPGSVANSNLYVSDHFCIRITKRPQDSEMAQPSPEGVHHDGSDIIMITLMNRENVEEGTGQSRVWNSEQPSGPYLEKTFENIKHKCLGNFEMMQPYETLLAIDSKVKHEARGIKPKLKNVECTRDVTVHWTRTPRISGCDTIGKRSDAVKWLLAGQKLFAYDNVSNPNLSFSEKVNNFGCLPKYPDSQEQQHTEEESQASSTSNSTNESEELHEIP